MKTIRFGILFGCWISALALNPTRMVAAPSPSIEMFIKVGNLEGESRDARHLGESDVISWSWTMNNSSTQAVGRVRFSDLRFTKPLDNASPGLMGGCASGQHFQRATLALRKGGSQGVEFHRIILEDVLVSSYAKASSTAADFPTENVTLNFARIAAEYTVIRPSGQPGERSEFTWDIPNNNQGDGISFPPLDTDGDRMPDLFEILHGLNFLVNDALLDSDGDGATNLEEFLAGTSPVDVNEVFRAVLSAVPGSRTATLSWTSATGKEYDVMVTDDLNSPFELFRTVSSAGDGLTTIEMPMDLAPRFFKVDLATGR